MKMIFNGMDIYGKVDYFTVLNALDLASANGKAKEDQLASKLAFDSYYVLALRMFQVINNSR